ncbi:hypothetical protein EVAR_79410_1 [Eumeta japonica]|uniref:Uncharacterized protein n=1 Tax=Eumeta variegata TaxID=151549 RepID=A0A4C1VGP6_EUMVA|nr:hypothetical protein EVAR_79410_1 [Eumeta japonica]
MQEKIIYGRSEVGKWKGKGTVVVLKSDNSAPLDWPLGVIEDVHPDQHRRAVVLETTVAAESEDIVQKVATVKISNAVRSDVVRRRATARAGAARIPHTIAAAHERYIWTFTEKVVIAFNEVAKSIDRSTVDKLTYIRLHLSKNMFSRNKESTASSPRLETYCAKAFGKCYAAPIRSVKAGYTKALVFTLDTRTPGMFRGDSGFPAKMLLILSPTNLLDTCKCTGDPAPPAPLAPTARCGRYYKRYSVLPAKSRRDRAVSWSAAPARRGPEPFFIH